MIETKALVIPHLTSLPKHDRKVEKSIEASEEYIRSVTDILDYLAETKEKGIHVSAKEFSEMMNESRQRSQMIMDTGNNQINNSMNTDFRVYFRGRFLGLWNDNESVRTEMECPKCSSRLYSDVSYDQQLEEEEKTSYGGPIQLVICRNCDFQANLRMYLVEITEENISWSDINFNESED